MTRGCPYCGESVFGAGVVLCKGCGQPIPMGTRKEKCETLEIACWVNEKRYDGVRFWRAEGARDPQLLLLSPENYRLPMVKAMRTDPAVAEMEDGRWMSVFFPSVLPANYVFTKVMNEITNLNRHAIVPSPTNPRKNFNPEKLKELAGTIKEHGIQQPLVVRRLGKKGPPVELYEIVCGERRWRASEIAGLETVPCIVRELTDQQVLEIQYIENLQRDDLSALEEAEGFAQLIRSGSYTAESLAEKLGRSRAHVFNRLRLARLQGHAREALESGTISTAFADLAARLPTEALQKKFVRAVTRPATQDPVSFRQAEDLLKREFIRNLGGQFDMKAADLVKGCGSCVECPKRSGNMPAFESGPDGRGGNPNVCTDVECFDRKLKAHGALKLKEAESNGQKVVRLKEWEELGWRSREYYAEPEEVCYDVGGKPYQKILGKDLPTVLVQTDKGVRELVDRKAARERMEAKGLLKREKRGKSDAEKKAALEQKIDRAAIQRGMSRLIEAIANPPRLARIGEELDRLLCSAILQNEVQIYDSYENTAKRRGIEPIVKKERGWTNKDLKTPFLDHFESLTAAEVRALLAELILANRAYQCSFLAEKDEDDGETHFERACKLFDVDLKAVAKEVRAEFENPKPKESKRVDLEKEHRAAENAKIAEFREKNGIVLANLPDSSGEELKETEGLNGTFTRAERPNGTLSPAARSRIAAQQRKRWAEAKAGARA